MKTDRYTNTPVEDEDLTRYHFAKASLLLRGVADTASGVFVEGRALSEVELRQMHRDLHAVWDILISETIHGIAPEDGSADPWDLEADAPNVVWAIDFQFDSTVDGKAIKIASMIDEHTRASLLHVVERSITAERLVIELEDVFAAAGGPPKVLRIDNGPELVSQALQRFCDGKVGLSYIPAGTPWNNGYIESFNNRLRKECLNRNHWNTLFEARVVIGDFKHEHNHRHRHSALGYRTPAEYAAACRHIHTPVACEIN